MRFLRTYSDFAIIALVLAAFVFVAGERLATVPVPDTDESMMLQISYEMLNHGKLAFPMKRFYGGNIENAWHSLTPVAFVTLSAFQKVFGWGLVQGRAYNLITAVLTLLMLYLVGRRLFSWPVALMAVVLVTSDPLFLSRSRLLRYDLLAAAFALLAFYLFQRAEERRRKWVYLASGLAAGAGVMSHTNDLYILAVIGLLMLVGDGWKLFKSSKLYVFAAGALLSMSYEIGFAIVDYQNFMLQTRKDDVHFRVLELWGWLNNLITEPDRYVQWFEARGIRTYSETLLLQIFLVLTAVSIVYLVCYTIYRALQRRRIQSSLRETPDDDQKLTDSREEAQKSEGIARDPRVMLLIATSVVILFFAFVTQRKVTQYVVHLAPWFALCVAVMLRDIVWRIWRMQVQSWRFARPVFASAAAIILLCIAAYGYELAKQNRNYLTNVRRSDQASFEDLKSALRSVVPDELCPASIASGYLWLAFPERDDCYFAYMEATLDESLQLEGKEYALILKPKFEGRVAKLTGTGFEKFHLLAELNRTAYGNFAVYYTGNDPRFLQLSPKRFYFFGRQSGYVSEDRLANSREVWFTDGSGLHSGNVAMNAPRSDQTDDSDAEEDNRKVKWSEVATVDLDPNSTYEIIADVAYSRRLEMVIANGQSSYEIQAMSDPEARIQRLSGLFKTSTDRKIKIALGGPGQRVFDPSSISHISIRVIP